jgi:hypothetical protein
MSKPSFLISVALSTLFRGYGARSRDIVKAIIELPTNMMYGYYLKDGDNTPFGFIALIILNGNFLSKTYPS